MHFKLFAAIFGVLLAVQASQQSPIKDDDLNAVIVAIYNQILNYEREILSKVSEYVENLEGDKAQIQAEVVEVITKLANSINNVIVKFIDELRPAATDDGKAVLDCIQAEQDKTDAAFNTLAADIGVCVVDNTLIYDALTALISQLSGLIDKAQAEVDTLSSCDSGDLACLTTFVLTRIDDLGDVYELLKQDVDEAVQLLVNLVNMVEGCVQTEWPVLNSLAQEIFNDAVVCIKA
ncbi:uncharacterized protein LOC126733932 [Anthonomus grandis grandis]|uniref:uncharacterized protein LOC126733932 n=1 Tax=Anthonomus grandis grandis TaxID=2921223 RepID=UPI0021657F24|nr:uncharacterized protein LOC126733932 [Anthonomus grandis grandis]